MTGHPMSARDLASTEQPIVFVIDDDASVREALGVFSGPPAWG